MSEDDDELSGRAAKWAQKSDQARNDDRSEFSDRSEASERSERDQNTDAGSDSPMSSEPSEPSEPSGRSDSSDPSDRGEESLNVKQDWSERYVYLPPEQHREVNSEFDRLVYECGRDLDWTPKKNRHYYPVLTERGLEAIREMGPEEFRDAVDDVRE
jgi:hypothetical protein